MQIFEKAVTILFDESSIRPISFTSESIKKAYFKKAKLTHPDRATSLGKSACYLEQEFKRLQEAYHFVLRHRHILAKKWRFQQREKFVSPKARNNSFYYQYSMPKRRLRFAEYLFYRRFISWHDLVQALVYQNSRPFKIGEVAIECKFLSCAQVEQILNEKKENEKFGDTAMRLGFLDVYRLFVLLGTQKTRKRKIGRYFVDKSIFSEEQIQKLLLEHRVWNSRWGV